MIQAVLLNILDGILRPRGALRRLLDAGHGYEVAAQMLLLGYLVLAILTVAIPGGRPDSEPLPGWYFVTLLHEGLGYLVTVGLVYGIGRFFGGKGRWIDAHLGIAWYTLVSAFIEPLTLPALLPFAKALAEADSAEAATSSVSGGALVLALGAGALMLWLLASCVAELHRFASTWKVLGAMFGLGTAFWMLLLALIPAA